MGSEPDEVTRPCSHGPTGNDVVPELPNPGEGQPLGFHHPLPLRGPVGPPDEEEAAGLAQLVDARTALACVLFHPGSRAAMLRLQPPDRHSVGLRDGGVNAW